MTHAEPFASPTQVAIALGKLTPNDHSALIRCAKNLLSGTSYSEPSDLVHEAFYRALDGRRRWLLRVDFMAFMTTSIKSIASSDRESYSNKFVVPASSLETDECSDPISEIGLRYPSPEDEYIHRECRHGMTLKRRQLTIDFSGDVQAQMIFEGWANELTPREIIVTSGLTADAYHAARKRIVRRINVASRYRQ